jgi:hypothetical protein
LLLDLCLLIALSDLEVPWWIVFLLILL